MQSYSQTFAANTTWELNVPGSYFTILSSTLSMNVRFYKGGKKLDMGDIAGMLAGLEVGPIPVTDASGFAFDRVQVDVQAGDTVKVGIGNGMAHYNRSNGTVDVNSLPAAVILQLIRPEMQSGSYQANATLAANTADQVFSAAANVNGAILLSADAMIFDTAGGSGVFITKATAPTSIIDGSIIVGTKTTVSTSNVQSGLTLPKEQYIGPGLGLFWITNVSVAATNFAYRACRYKLL